MREYNVNNPSRRTSTAYFYFRYKTMQQKESRQNPCKKLEKNSLDAWEKRIEKFTKNIPSVESNI
jgi:hypothetical protein